MDEVAPGVEEAVAAVARGELVVVVDDRDRENAGDLIMAAGLATPEKTSFMIRHTIGMLSTVIASDLARCLCLDPLVPINYAELSKQ